jgi:sulfur-oxidizing protein SoxY
MPHTNSFFTAGLALFCWLFSTFAVAAGEEDFAWNSGLKEKYFGERPIEDGSSLLELTAPYRAEDPALVPISVTSKIVQSPEHYIKKITLVIDNNPVPFAASFQFTPESGKADVATRMRFNAYTNLRAIAETNDGKLSMVKAFVKASGGCSAPIGGDMDAAMARLGKMKFKLDNDKIVPQQINQLQLLVSHPNITGLQMDQISRLIKPAYYVEDVNISFNGKPVLTARTDIAISADPYFRFNFLPQGPGELKVEIKDNQGKVFTHAQNVAP